MNSKFLLLTNQWCCSWLGFGSVLLGEMNNNPSNSPSKNRRRKGEGNGYIYWRTISKNGKDYPQAYYHWQEQGHKRTKYIPKRLLGEIQEAEAVKRPILEILRLLGVKVNPSKLLGDKLKNPSNITNQTSPSNDISPSKMRRNKGEGSGSIHWRTITKNGKDYQQVYYHACVLERGRSLSQVITSSPKCDRTHS